MEAPIERVCLFGLFLVASIAGLFGSVDGAGVCGSVPVDRMAINLAPCASATQDVQSQISATCCSQVHKLAQNPSCLCAVMLSSTARSAGVKPNVAMTIPKRCNFADRPVGYKCGDYCLDGLAKEWNNWLLLVLCY